jgi:uncharacterized protein
MKANYLIQKLQLQPHPEGGFYRETFRSEQKMTTIESNLRNVSTAIYYLLENEDRSHFHRIKSDESWFFHQGVCMEIVSLQDGELQTIWLGNNIELGEVPQITIPANTWFACKIKGASGYALVSCTVAPGFDFADFELANKNQLMEDYPNFKEVIEEFTL